jgi:hypothetical protein
MCQEFDWCSELKLLADDNELVVNESVKKFAESKLPNEFFLQQFTQIGKEPFCQKKYWTSFAKILINRGISCVKDVLETMLIWLQDINCPGSDLIWNFVIVNFAEFSQPLKKCIVSAIITDDIAWFNALLSLVYKIKGFSDLEISKKLSIDRRLLQANYSTNELYEIVGNIVYNE